MESDLLNLNLFECIFSGYWIRAEVFRQLDSDKWPFGVMYIRVIAFWRLGVYPVASTERIDSTLFSLELEKSNSSVNLIKGVISKIPNRQLSSESTPRKRGRKTNLESWKDDYLSGTMILKKFVGQIPITTTAKNKVGNHNSVGLWVKNSNQKGVTPILRHSWTSPVFNKREWY